MATEKCPDPKCGGRVEPQSDGNGNVLDKCVKCNRTPNRVRQAMSVGITAGSSTMIATGASTIATTPTSDRRGGGARACSVEGCPGQLDASGACPCCVKRAEFVEANLPKRSCSICGGRLTGNRAIKFCGACKPVQQRIYSAKHKPAATPAKPRAGK